MRISSKAVQSVGKILDLDIISKSQAIMVAGITCAFFIVLMLLIVKYLSQFYETGLNTNNLNLLISLCFFYVLSVSLVVHYGNHLKKKKRGTFFYPVLAIQTYVLANAVPLYFIGFYFFTTGVVIISSLIIGMILLPLSIIISGLISAVPIIIALAVLTSSNLLNHAPILSDATTPPYINTFWFVYSFSYFFINTAAIYLVAFASLKRWKQREQDAEFLSNTDVLTSISNRRHLMKNLKNEIMVSSQNSQPISFIMIDLDHFKVINDTYGHHQGDLVLQHVADALKSSIRQSDLAGRYGGEEFGIVLPNTSSETAMEIAERCRSNIANHDFHNEAQRSMIVAASIGVATKVIQGSEEIQKQLENLLIQADKALYRAKYDGRNRVIHHSAMASDESKYIQIS